MVRACHGYCYVDVVKYRDMARAVFFGMVIVMWML